MMKENKEQDVILGLFDELDFAEVGLYLVIKSKSEDNENGVNKNIVFTSSSDSKEESERVLNGLIKKGYVEVINDTIKIIK